MKTCTSCNVSKSLEEFNKKKKSPDGLYPQCRECKNKKDSEDYVKNKEKRLEKARLRYLENRETILEKAKVDPVRKEYGKNYHITHREELLENMKEYKKLIKKRSST